MLMKPRGALGCSPRARRICRKVTGADGGRGDRRASQAAYRLSLPPSLCLSPQLQQLGGGGELIMEAVKPSHSLVSLSNEVSAIKAL